MSNCTWTPKYGNGWNTIDNWNPPGPPTGTATFGETSQAALSFGQAGATVGEIQFVAGAPHYVIYFTWLQDTGPQLTINGAGVTDASGMNPTFIIADSSLDYTDAQLVFDESASAGPSTVSYVVGPSAPNAMGGGVLSFRKTSNAGAASFTVTTGSIPVTQGTVGGEVAFCHQSSANQATFTIWGSTGTDGDTFGNVVFHDQSTAALANFINKGGTVSGGDGGNTQFYVTANAGAAHFDNFGGTVAASNGGDVAFDGTSSAAGGSFDNHPATVSGAYGGVTSFNNNKPYVNGGGATAAKGRFDNHGATSTNVGGGGHTEFSARYGSPDAGTASIYNHGSEIAGASSAGHTVFSVTLPTSYFPTAANATIWNYGARAASGAAGFTQFAIYDADKGTLGTPPTAGNAQINNDGAYIQGAAGGYTVFSGATTAGSATLIANGGTNGGSGGQIIFYDTSSGGTASVTLNGNGQLSIGDHTGPVTLGQLEVGGSTGIVSIQLGTNLTTLNLTGSLLVDGDTMQFSLWTKNGGGFERGTNYAILTAPNLTTANFSASDFTANDIDGAYPSFYIDDNYNTLYVTY